MAHEAHHGAGRRGRGPRRGRRARPDAEEARADAQLPGARARALLAGDDRARAAAVHRHQQRRGAALQPRPARRGSTPRRSRRTTTPASAPTTTSSTCRATRSSSTAPSPTSLPHDHAEHVGLPSAKVLGGPRGRAKAFRPDSLVNISGDELRLACPATRSRRSTRGAKQAGCMHNTGEGGLSPYHRQGGDIVLQIGTAYFGCRDDDGAFDLEPSSRRSSSPRRCGRSRSSSRRAPSRGSAGCCRPPR